MAANMPQMAGNGHIMQQNGQRQLQAVVYNQLMSNPPPLQGWQSGINVADRFGKTMNLFVYIPAPLVISSSQGAAFTDSIYRISNIILAMPGAEWQKAAAYGVDYEKKALMGSSDRVCPT